MENNFIVEEWKTIPGCPSTHQISNKGNVRVESMFGEYEYKKPTYSSGYQVVKFFNRIFYIHKIVAEAFIPNPNNCDKVCHIDKNKTNNSVDNLKWISSSQLAKDSYLESRKIKKLWKIRLCNSNKIFETMLSAAVYTQLPINLVKHSLETNATVFGYKFQYELQIKPEDKVIYISNSDLLKAVIMYDSYDEFIQSWSW